MQGSVDHRDPSRAAWLISGLLLVATGLTAGWMIWRSWLPCAGSMGTSTPYWFVGNAPFTDACLDRMDTWWPLVAPGSSLEVVVVLTGAAAWCVLVWGLRLTGPRLPLALAPAACSVLLLVGRESAVGSLVLWLVAVSAAWVACAAVAAESAERLTGGLIVPFALWAATPFGGLHLFFDYLVTGIVNQANWDAPPGMGYLSVATTVVVGLVVMSRALRPADRPGRQPNLLVAPASP